MPYLRRVSEEPHGDYVTGVEANWYGRRLATSTADSTLRVRDLDANGEWVMTSGGELKRAHAVCGLPLVNYCFVVERASTFVSTRSRTVAEWEVSILVGEQYFCCH